jgi:hypothetical protein
MSASFPRLGRFVRLFYLLLAISCSGVLSAQEPPAAGAEGQGKDNLREQTIYIPYSKLRDVFEKEGRGVFLPYEKFQELWKAAQESQRATPEPRPPVGALITEISSKATASTDVLVVEARVKIELLQEGWHRVPLRLADAAIRSAKIGDQPARIVPQEGGGYALLIERPAGDQPATIELVLEYARAIEKSPGHNSVSIQAPQAPVNRWEIHIPESGVKVDVQPLIAATEPPAAAEAPQNETVVLAFVGAAEGIRIDWNPKAEGASGLAALLSVQAEQEVVIDEGVVRTRACLVYQISRAELTELQIEVPADQKVAGVFDANIRQWDVTTEGDVQRIRVQLFEPARTAQTVTIDLEQFSGEKMSSEVTVPFVRARDVGRQQGLLVVRVASTLRSAPARRSGLLQLDKSELPPTVADRTWDYAFRYAALPFELALNIEKVEPRVRVEQYVHAYLEPDQLNVDLLAIYQIERAGVFQLQLDIPEGYEVRQVRGQDAEGVTGVGVDSHHPDPANAQRRLINLSRKAEGRVGLFVELTRSLSDPNLQSPTGASSQIALQLPRVASDGLEQETGRLIIFAPESLRVTPSTQKGVQSISFSEATQPVPYLRRGDRFAEMREVVALAYTRDPVELTLSVERRKPQILVRQFVTARVDSGVVRYHATFFYDIKYSPVKTLRIDIPQPVASLVRNETASIRDEVVNPAPQDVPEGYVAWQFTGESEFIGSPQIDLQWEQPIDQLDIGESVELSVPRLIPVGADRAWGQIVVTKSETIDIRESGEPKGLRAIDPQLDLMPGATATDAARAFEFHDDWTLTLAATRYQLFEVKRTSIELALIRMLVTRSDQIDVQALYRMRSARQRLAVQFPPRVDPEQSFDAQPARLNGQPVTLERGDGQEFYIPLVGVKQDDLFLLELRYTIAGQSDVLDFPIFPDDPAVGQVYLSVYLPEEQALLGTQGPWNQEQFNPWRVKFSEVVSLVGHKQPWQAKNDREIYNQVVGGISGVAGDPLGSFGVQGDRFLFSTLRPTAPPNGALRVKTLDTRFLNSLLVIIAIAIGLVMISQPINRKLMLVGVVIILVVMGGVFWPTAALEIINGKLVLAGFLVLVLWITAGIVRRGGWVRDVHVAWPWQRRAARATSPPVETPKSDAEQQSKGGTP